MGYQTCKRCGEDKPISEFYSAGKFGRDKRCKPCFKKETNIRKELRKEAFEKGILYEGVECPICSKITTLKPNTKDTAVVDHCHETKTMRGILCMACNSALGKFGDNTILLRKAINYLERNCDETRSRH